MNNETNSFAAISSVESSNTPPNNEIWYTTDNGSRIDVNNNGFDATVISNVYSDGKGVIKFNLDVTTIDEEAFKYSDHYLLTNVYLPNSITELNNGAFCRASISSITIPASVSIINNNISGWDLEGTEYERPCDYMKSAGVFSGLSNITVDNGNTTFDSRNDCNAIINTASNTLITGSANTVIPESVTKIGKCAFSECVMTSINIPSSITFIDELAFFKCEKLTSINIPAGITSIKFGTFAGCWALSEITIPNEVTEIGNAAFAECGFSGNLIIPDSIKTINTRAYDSCMKITSVTIGKNVNRIDEYAFIDCSGLSTIIYKNVTYTDLFEFMNAFSGYCSSNAFSNTPIADNSGYGSSSGW